MKNDMLPEPNLDGLDINSLSSWQHRIALASLGWHTSAELKKGFGYTGWHYVLRARHWNWHGTLCQVHLGSSHFFPVGITPWDDTTGSLNLVTQAHLSLHRQCLEAWRTCSNYVPYGKRANGVWERDELATQHFRRFPHGVVRPERARPTEALPGWPGQVSFQDFLLSDNGGDGVALPMIENARQCDEADIIFIWRDKLVSWGRGDDGEPGAHINRQWLHHHHGYPSHIKNSSTYIKGKGPPRYAEVKSMDMSSAGSAELGRKVVEVMGQVIQDLKLS